MMNMETDPNRAFQVLKYKHKIIKIGCILPEIFDVEIKFDDNTTCGCIIQSLKLWCTGPLKLLNAAEVG
jgi:hypothetical protein